MRQEALQGMEPDLNLSLDDFIPPHLQKQNRTHDGHTQDGSSEGDFVYKATLVVTDDILDSPSPQKERRWIRYEGIGPTDKDGMPFASRSSVDKPREWYKNMYKVLHQMSDSEDSDGESKPTDRHKDASTVSNASRLFTDQNKDQSELEDGSKRTSQEPSRLHITVQSSIRTPPSKYSSTLKIETSPNTAKPRTATLPCPSSHHPAQTSPDFSSKVSHFIPNSNISQSSQHHNTQQSHRVLSSTSSNPWTSEPGPRQSSQNIMETSLRQNYNYSSSARPSSGKQSINPTSRKPRRSSTKFLEQLENDLRNFTEELDKDLEARKQQNELTLEQCEELILQRCSSRAVGGSPEPKVNKSRRDYRQEQDLSPVGKALVKFDFVAESEKEISLQRGTTLNILKQIDEHWLLGEQDGRRGLVPESYVRVLSPGQQEALDTPQLSGIALYDFPADSDAELPLRKGQRVLINRRVGGNWFEGRVEGCGRLGLFPASYVQVTDGLVRARKVDAINQRAPDTNTIEQVSSPLTLKERPYTVKAPSSNRLQDLQGTLYRVLFNYFPKDTDELQLNAGDVVTVTQQCEDGWFVGACWRTQKFGTFPGNFVAPYETA
ncbi:vinexin isoform X4 [Engystomops pustulosus]|uniref:vinexin isoform X4 n=1 Tax=Engystomops pustulosus TaxID=76066 RepID=UPI003AFA12D9